MRIKRLIARISCVALAGAMIFCTPTGNTTYKPVIDFGVDILIADAAGSATNGGSYTAGTGGSVSSGWGSSGVVAYRIYPASIDASIEGTGSPANGDSTRLDLVGYSIFLYPNAGVGSNFNDYLVVSEDGTGWSPVEIPSACLYHKNDTITKGAFQGLADILYKTVGTKTINNSISQEINTYMDSCVQEDGTDNFYEDYLSLIKTTFGDEAVTKVSALHDGESKYFVGESNLTYIVEPLVNVTNANKPSQSSFISLYDALNQVNTKKGYTSLKAKEKMDGYGLKSGSSWATSNKCSTGTGEGNPNWCSKYYSPLVSIKPLVREMEDIEYGFANGYAGAVAAMTKHAGWWWFSSMSGGGVTQPSVYGVAEGMRFSVNVNPDETDLSVINNGLTSFDGTTLLDSYVSGRIANKYIVKNYYKRMSATEFSTETLKEYGKYLSTYTSNDATFTYTDFEGDVNANLTNIEKLDYYRNLAPHQLAKEIGNDNLTKDKQDYIIGNGTATNGKVVTPDVMPYATNYVDLFKIDTNAIKDVDFEINSITVDVYEGNFNDVTDNVENVALAYTFEIPADDNIKQKLKEGKEINLRYNTTVDMTGTTTLFDYLEYLSTHSDSGIYSSIVVTYNYAQSYADIPEKAYKSEGKLQTSIPQWAINNEYSNIKSADSHSATVSQWDAETKSWITTDTEDGYVHAHIYAPFRQAGYSKVSDSYVDTTTGETVDTLATKYTSYTVSGYNKQSEANSKIAKTFTNNGATGDVNLYYNIGGSSSKLLSTSLPYISSSNLDYTTNAIDRIANKGIFSPMKNNYSAEYDAQYTVKKSAEIDKLRLADWVDTLADNPDKVIVDDIIKNGTREGLPPATRVGEGNLLFSGSILNYQVQQKDITYKYSGKEAKTTYLTLGAEIDDSNYKATCDIANYRPIDKSYTTNYKENEYVVTEKAPKSSGDTIYKNYDITSIMRYGRTRFIPEVTMMYKNNKTVSTTTVCGTKDREVDLIAYSTITPSLESTITASGTVVATDSRAIALRDKIGTAATQVLYGGSDVFESVAYSDATNTGLAMHTYVLDVDTDHYSTAIKSRTAGNPKQIAQDFVDDFTGRDVNIATVNDIYRNWSDAEPIASYHSKPTTMQFKSAGLSTESTYRLIVKDGKVIRVLNTSGEAVIGRMANGELGCISIDYKPLRDAIVKMQLDTLFTNSMETRGDKNNGSDTVTSGWSSAFNSYLNSWGLATNPAHWYGEDTSIFVIRDYVAELSVDGACTTTFKIPINAGPSTPASSKEYFKNGYGVYVNQEITMNIDGHEIPIVKTSRGKNAKPHYIIADVTTDNLY